MSEVDEQQELRKIVSIETEKNKELVLKIERLKKALEIAIQEIHLEYCTTEHNQLCVELNEVLFNA